MGELVAEGMTNEEEAEIGNWIYGFFKKVVDAEKELSADLYNGYAGIDMTELDGYIEWRANLLLQNFGLDKIFDCKVNPMIWINAYDPVFINNSKTDFFEKRPVNYSKVTEDKNSWDDL